MKLSIIICVYNTPVGYLDECLRSITESTLDRRDFEICMVDDGSSVDYTDLIIRYGVRCQRTENRGIFAARLTGIEMAEGDYIAFVDSDDSVSCNYHMPMLKCALETGADIVYNDWAFHGQRTRYYCKNDTTVSRGVSADGDDVLLEFVKHEGSQHSLYVLWNKIYKREIVKALLGELIYVSASEESFNYSEDALMNFYLHKWAKRVRSVHTGYYFYRIHEAQSVGVTSFRKLRSQIRQMGFTLAKMQTNIGKNVHFREISEHITGWKRLMARAHYSHAATNGYFELFPYIKEKYGVDKLRRAIPRDGRAYERAGLIGDNIVEVDRALISLWHSEGMVEVTIPKDRYALLTVSFMIREGKPISTERVGNVVIPRERISLKNRIIFNSLVRRVAMILFPRGSKVRAWLKRKL